MKATKYILSISLLVLLIILQAHSTPTIPDSLEEPTPNIPHSETTISQSETNSQLTDDSSFLSEEKEEFAEKTLHDYAYVGKSVREKEYPLLPTKSGINLATKIEGKRIVIQVTVGRFTVSHIQHNGKKWQLITAPHSHTLKSYGKPQLPYRKVFIPVTSKLKTFKVEEQVTKTLPDVRPLPGAKPVPLSLQVDEQSYQTQHFYCDPIIYEQGKDFPDNAVNKKIITYMGHKFLSLTVFPFKFRPNFADIHVTNLKVIVGFHSTPSKLALLEGDALAQYPLSSHAKRSTTLTTLDGPQPKYVIIRPTGWGTAINAFKSWKESYNGFTVQERSPTWITSHYPGDDKAERVKNFINDSYITNGTKYFLLVGDSDKVPVQQVWAGQQPYAYGYLDDNGSLPSDYYYECLGKWDTNDDQIYGAPNDTGMDIYPEVRIGRIPVKTATQAKNSLARIVSREKNPVLGN